MKYEKIIGENRNLTCHMCDNEFELIIKDEMICDDIICKKNQCSVFAKCPSCGTYCTQFVFIEKQLKEEVFKNYDKM